MELMTREPEARAQMEQGLLSVAKAAAIETHVMQEVRAGVVAGRGAESAHRRELVTELSTHSVRELRGHVPTQDMYKLVIADFLKRHDPLRSQPKREAPALDPTRDAELARGQVATPAPEQAQLFQFIYSSQPASRYVPADHRRAIHHRAAGRCESRYRLQIDHRVQYALGGPTTVENLQLCCPTHNQHRTRHLGGGGAPARELRRLK